MQKESHATLPLQSIGSTCLLHKWCRLNSRILKQLDNIFRIFVILKILHSFRWGRFSLFLVPSIHSYVHYGHCFFSPIFYRMFMIMQVVVSALAGQQDSCIVGKDSSQGGHYSPKLLIQRPQQEVRIVHVHYSPKLRS